MSQWIEMGTDPISGAKRFRSGAFTVLVSGPGTKEYEETGRWHMSIAHPWKYPDWDTMRSARYLLLPADITMAMLLPPEKHYVNMHSNCFHLYETRDI